MSKSSGVNFIANFDEQVSPHKGVTLVIFGGSGDLTKKKLMPILFRLHTFNLLPQPIHIICYGRTSYTTETYRKMLRELGNYDEDFLDLVYYVSGQYTACPEMQKILSVAKGQSPNRLFYLSLPPAEFRNVCMALKGGGLITRNSGGEAYFHTKIGQQPYTRIIFEKPFGNDYTSAVKLHRFISNIFDSSQVFCIDHYLGKEPIQNILFFRFANSIFEHLWNGRYVDHIQISLNEDVRVEKRAGYFDTSGILKDMVQSHALQILALTMMEPPTDFSAKNIQQEKNKVLESLRPYVGADALQENVVRGQYAGYLQEEGVAENSKTETFFACKTYVDNWRWAGIPVYIRSGKALKEQKTELVMHFRGVPHNIFHGSASLAPFNSIESNRIVFRFQPETYIRLKVQTKKPGNKINLLPTDMDFPYSEQFQAFDYSNGYDRMLFAAMSNDASLFLSSSELFSQWKFTDSILDNWNDSDLPLHSYEISSGGPVEAETLLHKEGKTWN